MSLGRAPGRTDLAGGEEGRWPRRLRQLPSRGSVNWLVREARAASPPAGRLACTHTHPHPTAASARARTHTHPHSHSHKARLARDSATPTRRLATEATVRPQTPRPGGAVTRPRLPAPLPARRSRLEPGSRRPGAGLWLGGQSSAASARRSADPGSSPAP